MRAVEESANLWFAGGRVSALGNGHIHETYLLEGDDGDRSSLVLQRINNQVFPSPETLMTQTMEVLDHLRSQGEVKVPHLMESRDGNFMEELDSGYWRAWEFIDHSRTVDPLENLEQVRNGAQAFGLFHSAMAEMNQANIREIIPGYQQLGFYLEGFDQVRRGAPSELLRVIEGNNWIAQRFSKKNWLIHGDCKIDNLLFKSSGDQVQAILDLDTVMLGHWAWDFGDYVRSLWLGRETIDIEFFRLSIEGFLNGGLSPDHDPEDFADAPLYISFMLGIRFLTDHLQGDKYFRINYEGENLLRAEAQFKLFERCLQSRELLISEAAGLLKDY
ncbi:MAG: phosphotransferase enzyme family protein [Candidatus Azotimanducaceae bacterium]